MNEKAALYLSGGLLAAGAVCSLGALATHNTANGAETTSIVFENVGNQPKADEYQTVADNNDAYRNWAAGTALVSLAAGAAIGVRAVSLR